MGEAATAVQVKACPFCGEDDPFIDEIEPGRFALVCPDCGTIGPASEVSQQGAILAWNIRP